MTIKTGALFSPDSYKKATPEQINIIVNGCGSAQAKFDFVPDTIYGLNITPACHIHDWMYHFGQDNNDKLEADRVYLNNMLRIINKKRGWLMRLRRFRAWEYYKLVSMFGGSAFWDPKN